MSIEEIIEYIVILLLIDEDITKELHYAIRRESEPTRQFLNHCLNIHAIDLLAFVHTRTDTKPRRLICIEGKIISEPFRNNYVYVLQMAKGWGKFFR